MGKRNSYKGPWGAVARSAESQLGLVTIGQLRAAGVPDSTIDDAVRRERLHPVFHGVYAVGHRYLTEQARLLAATLACGPGTVVSHGTAAWLLGLRADRPESIDVIAPVEAGRKIAGVRRRFVPPPLDAEVWVRGRVPVTSPARAIVDCAGKSDLPELKSLVEQAAILGILDVRAIDRVLDGRRRRGAGKVRRAIEPWRRYRRGIHIRSRMEARLLPLLTEAALPIPETNVRLRIQGKRYEVDFLWRSRKLVVETDGGAFHDNPAAGDRDSDRNRALLDAGYNVPRLGWEDLRDRPDQTMRELALLLRR